MNHGVVQTLVGWLMELARNAVLVWLAATCVALLVLAACRLVAGRARIARRVRRRMLSARRGRRRRRERLSAARGSKRLLRWRGSVSDARAK